MSNPFVLAVMQAFRGRLPKPVKRGAAAAKAPRVSQPDTRQPDVKKPPR